MSFDRVMAGHNPNPDQDVIIISDDDISNEDISDDDDYSSDDNDDISGDDISHDDISDDDDDYSSDDNSNDDNYDAALLFVYTGVGEGANVPKDVVRVWIDPSLLGIPGICFPTPQNIRMKSASQIFG